MKIVTVFDLDGVLIDNVAFEQAVTEQIVRTISTCQNISIEEASSIWNQTLRSNSLNPRWHDYAIHCAALGVPDAWKSSHLAMRHIIRKMPKADEAVSVGRASGPVWIASDATNWVALLKLRMAEIDRQEFDELFTLDRCGVSKGHDEFWKYLRAYISDPNTATIYVDNRLDRLLTAKKTLPHCRTLHIAAEDHPLGLRIFPDPVASDYIHSYRVTHEDLPDVIRRIASELTTLK